MEGEWIEVGLVWRENGREQGAGQWLGGCGWEAQTKPKTNKDPSIIYQHFQSTFAY